MGNPVDSQADDAVGEAGPGAGPVRLLERNGRWQVMVGGPAGWTSRGSLAGAEVDALRRKGRLRDRADGSCEVLASTPAEREAAARPGFNDAESPLSWLRTRKDKTGRPLISEQHYQAGERLRADFGRAMLAQRVTASWDVTAAARRGGGHVAADLSDSALAARQRFHKAMDAVGPELASILYQVCCLAAGLEQAERLLGLPQRSGKAVLGLALTALVRHYGAAASAGTRSTSQWGLPDYRPAIPDLEDA